MAHIGTYYFNRSNKELLYQDHSIRATLAKRGVTKTSTSSITFSTLFTAPISRLSLSVSKQCYKALLKYN